MRWLLRLCAVVPMFVCLAQQAAVAAVSPAEMPSRMDAIVERFRQVIVLTGDEETLDAVTRSQVKTIAWMLFEQNHEDLATLSAALNDDGKPNYPSIAAFLDRLESTSVYRDADKLVFRDALEELADGLTAPADAKLSKRVAEDRSALRKIQALYEKEIAKAMGFQTRAMPVRREAWEHYTAFLRQKYTRDALLKQYQEMLPASETRSGAPKKHDEIVGSELPPKTILLTFDDGPHPRYTDQILAILKQNNLQAVFFEVGKNLGTVKDGQVKLGNMAKISDRILASGSTLGNHSYSHPVLPKLPPAGQAEEIESTSQLLRTILKADPVLFRPPYGANSDSVEQRTKSDNLKTMIWNIDSLDWADPVPASITKRVLDEVDKTGRGIILFHDIHNRAIEVLPQLIATLKAKGYTFVSWNQAGLGGQMRGTDATVPPPVVESPYRESWAVVIGVDKYQHWPQLSYAAHDAQGVHDVLVNRYRFKPENVFMLLDEQATRQNILSVLGDKLGNPDLVKHDDRVFVFFAGHGATRKLPSGRELGYIIPVEADPTSFEGQAISMTNFQDISETIPAKHLLFVMDSCYSGLALTRGASVAYSQNYLSEITRREARQMFTAGGADQQVADNGPNGHSVFTWTLLQALDGRGDLNGDGVITASELAAYVTPAVSALSQQTPAFGNLAGSEGGDVIFELRHETEFLDAGSTQLSDEAIRLNAELEKLRQQNEQLRAELAAAKAAPPQPVAASVVPASMPSPASAPVMKVLPKNAFALNDEGMRSFKEKNYSAARDLFIQAVKMDSTRALFANNAGFACVKLERYDEAVEWYQKTIALDPARAVAYLNLGDALAQLQRISEARKAYEQYLVLAPASKSAAYAHERLDALSGK